MPDIGRHIAGAKYCFKLVTMDQAQDMIRELEQEGWVPTAWTVSGHVDVATVMILVSFVRYSDEPQMIDAGPVLQRLIDLQKRANDDYIATEDQLSRERALTAQDAYEKAIGIVQRAIGY